MRTNEDTYEQHEEFFMLNFHKVWIVGITYWIDFFDVK